MSNSALASYTNLSPNHSGKRTHTIDTVTIHCFVGQVTAQRGCDAFKDKSKKASCNYVVGYDGSIGLCVDEANRSWCTSSTSNDNRAVTIEVASDNYDPYAVTDKAYAALINLLVNICQRNGISRLVWSTSKDDRVNHKNGCNMTVHRDYANKACPGEWLYSRHGQIAAEVNKKLEAAKAGKDEETMDIKQITTCANTGDNPSTWAKEATDYCKRKGIFAGDGAGNYGWQQPITREAVAQVLYNLLETAGMLNKLPDVK